MLHTNTCLTPQTPLFFSDVVVRGEEVTPGPGLPRQEAYAGPRLPSIPFSADGRWLL